MSNDSMIDLAKHAMSQSTRTDIALMLIAKSLKEDVSGSVRNALDDLIKNPDPFIKGTSSHLSTHP